MVRKPGTKPGPYSSTISNVYTLEKWSEVEHILMGACGIFFKNNQDTMLWTDPPPSPGSGAFAHALQAMQGLKHFVDHILQGLSTKDLDLLLNHSQTSP